MKVLVMGGTEFVSGGMARYLIGLGYEVDIFTRGVKPVKYDGVRRHFVGDRRNRVELERELSSEEYEYVFDISAYTRDDVEKLIGCLNRKSLKRYVFCSSGAVYRESKDMLAEEFPRGENVNWGKYGFDKYEAENYLFELFKSEEFPVTIFRPSYIYGEGNNLYREAYFFDRVLSGKAIPIPDGDTITQFIHIDDLVKLFESSLHSDRSIGQAYNATNIQIVSWEFLLEVIMKTANKRVDIKKINDKSISTREYFPFRDVTYFMSMDKVKMDGLHYPEIDLSEGLSKTYQFYCENKMVLKDARMNKMEEVLNL